MLFILFPRISFPHRQLRAVIKLPDATLVGWLLLYYWGKKVLSKAIWCRRDFDPFRPLLHCHNNFVRSYQKTVSLTIYTPFTYYYYVGGCTFTPSVVCRLCVDRSSAYWYGIHSRSTNLLHNCAVALIKGHHNLHLARVNHSMYLRFTLFIVSYNSAYIIFTQWLVGL